MAALPENGIAIVPTSADLEPHLRDDIDVRRVGPVDVELRDDGAHVAFGGVRIRFPLTSRHQAQNALTAMTAYEALGLPLERLPESAATVLLSPWRGEELPLPGGGFVVNDAYNANPTSMEAALRTWQSAAPAAAASRYWAEWPSSASTPTGTTGRSQSWRPSSRSR